MHNTSTNATLNDNPITFPLDQSLYVDATHEVVVLHGEAVVKKLTLDTDCHFLVITALNLTNFAKDGPLPSDHIPPNRAFISSQLAPFATNVQFQRKRYSTRP